jgi:oligoribonuclease (3'-5' exoribonuclease)
MLSSKNVYFIVDFETTGVDPDTDYPIEVGIVVADGYMNIKKFYSSLILVPDTCLQDSESPDSKTWEEDYLGAFNVHKISPQEIQKKGKPIEVVVQEILNLAKQYTVEKKKPILISDNIQFEYRFMINMFSKVDMKKEFPFHYCGWDSSLLLEPTGIGDPVAAHRALPDAMLLYTALVRGLQKVGRLPVFNKYNQ